MLILHLGAKARALPEGGVAINDPANLLTWRGADRAQLVLGDPADAHARMEALQTIVRQWIRYV